jgi:hypothetical protein
MGLRAGQQADKAVGQAEKAGDSLSSGDPLAAAQQANSAAGAGRQALNSGTDALAATQLAFDPPKTANGEPVAIRSESFGTACRNAQGAWTVMTKG